MIKRSKQDIGKEVCGRYPGLHYWEHTDPRLIVCEIFLQHNNTNANAASIPSFKQNDKFKEPVIIYGFECSYFY